MIEDGKAEMAIRALMEEHGMTREEAHATLVHALAQAFVAAKQADDNGAEAAVTETRKARQTLN